MGRTKTVFNDIPGLEHMSLSMASNTLHGFSKLLNKLTTTKLKVSGLRFGSWNNAARLFKGEEAGNDSYRKPWLTISPMQIKHFQPFMNVKSWLSKRKLKDHALDKGNVMKFLNVSYKICLLMEYPRKVWRKSRLFLKMVV